jgi:hypothetical protein
MGIQAFNDRDLETVKEVFREDLVYCVAGRSLTAGEYRGIEQYKTSRQPVRERSGNTIVLKPHIALADDQTVMLYAHLTTHRGGKLFDSEIETLLPDLVQEVDTLITQGQTYRAIAAHLEAQGHKVSKSAVARYGKRLLARVEHIQTMTEMAQALTAQACDLDLEEAAMRAALVQPAVVDYTGSSN